MDSWDGGAPIALPMNETCGNTTQGDLAQCYGHGSCVYGNWGVRHAGTWYCQCSRFWDARTNCSENYFQELGDLFLIAPIISIAVGIPMGSWMILEIVADFFRNQKRINVRTPAFAAKLMLVGTVSCFIISSAVLTSSVRARDVLDPVVFIAFDSFGVYGLAATSCLLVTLWLSMIMRVKHLDSRSEEGRTLYCLSVAIYVVVALTACAYIAMSILLGLNVKPLLQSYTQVTVQIVNVVFVVSTTSVFLQRLTVWIAKEASANPRLHHIQRKNTFIIANNVLTVLGLAAFLATNLALEQPSLYLVSYTALRVVYMLQIIVLGLFLQNHATRGGYRKAFQGIRSSISNATGNGEPSSTHSNSTTNNNINNNNNTTNKTISTSTTQSLSNDAEAQSKIALQ